VEFVAATYIGNFNDRELIFEVYDEVNRYFSEEGLPLRLLYVGRLEVGPGYVINIQTENGSMKLYPLEAIIEALHSKLLQEIENKGDIRMNKIFALAAFPLVSRNPYFDFFERFFGIQGEVAGLKMMVLSVKPFESGIEGSENPRELLKRRLVKGVLHEIGHGFGLRHCRNDCVMNPPEKMEEWDSRYPGYCDSCFINLKRAVEWSELSLSQGDGEKRF